MNWFQRHINWSLVLGVVIIPLVVWMIVFVIFGLVVYSGVSGMPYASEEYFEGFLASMVVPFFMIYIVLLIAQFAFSFFVTWWYLGQKARSRWLSFLFFVPFGLIILLLLENQAVGYGGDFISEPATDYWRPDTGQFGGYDSEKLRELDYSPAKNIEDIAYGGVVKDVGDTGVPGGEVPPPFPPKASEETPPEVSAQIPPEIPAEMPPEVPPEPPVEFSVEAVAEVPAQVPSEVPVETPPEVSAQVPPEVPVETGAETRAEPPPEVPLETTVEFSVEAVDEFPPQTPVEAPAEAKVAEEAVRPEALKMPILLDDAGAVIRCFYHPDADAVNLCSRCGQYVCSRCNYVTGTHPICRNCWERRGEAPVAGVAAGAGESARPGKVEKLKAEEDERLREFMQLYEQAAPIISIVIKREADGSPSPPLELMEGLKLRPMLEHVQKLPEPDGKELQEAMKEFEQLLLICIKVAEAAAALVSSGEEAVPGEADLTRLSMDIATANGLMQGLSQRLASLSQSPGD